MAESNLCTAENKEQHTRLSCLEEFCLAETIALARIAQLQSGMTADVCGGETPLQGKNSNLGCFPPQIMIKSLIFVWF